MGPRKGEEKKMTRTFDATIDVCLLGMTSATAFSLGLFVFGLLVAMYANRRLFADVVILMSFILSLIVLSSCSAHARRDPVLRTVEGAAVGVAAGAAGGAIAGNAGKGAAIGAVVGGLLGLATSEPEYPSYYPDPYSCYYIARPYGPPALVCPEPPPPPVIVVPRYLRYYQPPVIVIEPRPWWGGGHRGFGRGWNGGHRGGGHHGGHRR